MEFLPKPEETKEGDCVNGSTICSTWVNQNHPIEDNYSSELSEDEDNRLRNG